MQYRPTYFEVPLCNVKQNISTWINTTTSAITAREYEVQTWDFVMRKGRGADGATDSEDRKPYTASGVPLSCQQAGQTGRAVMLNINVHVRDV